MEVGLPRTPRQAARRAARISLRFGNYIRRNRLQIRTEGYAILLGPGHDFRLPIYHVSPTEQVHQLREAGFGDPGVFAEQHEDYFDEQWPYAYYYIARRL
jgi:hypothetical protein